MSKKTKTFDCVRLKNEIQAKLAAEVERLGSAEAARRHRQWLETSTAPLPRWWRSVSAAKGEPQAQEQGNA